MEGAHSWHPALPLALASLHGVSAGEALHLAARYGDRAPAVAARVCRARERGTDSPLLEGEVLYSVEEEGGGSVGGVLLRVGGGEGEVASVGEVMAQALGWDEGRRGREQQEAREGLEGNIREAVALREERGTGEAKYPEGERWREEYKREAMREGLLHCGLEQLVRRELPSLSQEELLIRVGEALSTRM